MAGCQSVAKTLAPPIPTTMSEFAGEVHGTGGLALLSWVGGLSTLAGIAARVLTKGSMGMRAIIAGICLVLLNVLVANYLSWIMVPMLIGTGCVSLCWAYVTIRGLIDKDD